MKKEIFCSFICAVYNREKYIKKALESMLYQTSNDFEIITVNDGSNDHTENIIKSFVSDKIKYFKTTHSGCWKTKNFAISQTKGKFLCFIDSDDYISENYLASAINLIEKNNTYEYFYPTLMNIVQEDESPTGSIWRYIDYPISNRKQLIKLFWERQIGGIPHAGAFIKREVFQRYGMYNDSFYNLSDTDYVIRNALKIKFLLLPELLYYYNRQHPKQTNANNQERFRTYSEILEYIIKEYPTEYFLNHKFKKNSSAFFKICLEKYMSLSQATNNNIYFLEKAKKYLHLLRQTEK